MSLIDVAWSYLSYGWDLLLWWYSFVWTHVSSWAASLIDVASPVFKKFDYANWIAVSAAAISVFSVYQNNKSASQRDKLKTKREEFNKQIGAPIEKALDEFLKLSDKLQDIAASQVAQSSFKPDDAITEASQAQRKLSRAIKKAAASELCTSENWAALGDESYDNLISAIDNSRVAVPADVQQRLIEGSDFAEKIVDTINDRLYKEIEKYI